MSDLWIEEQINYLEDNDPTTVRLKELKVAYELESELKTHIVKKNAELRYELDAAKRIAYNMSVMFKPKETKLGNDVLPEIIVPIIPKIPTLADFGDISNDRAKNISLPVMISKIDDDVMKGNIHLQVYFGKANRWGYAISYDALYSAPLDILQNMIYDEFMFQVASDLKKISEKF